MGRAFNRCFYVSRSVAWPRTANFCLEQFYWTTTDSDLILWPKVYFRMSLQMSEIVCRLQIPYLFIIYFMVIVVIILTNYSYIITYMICFFTVKFCFRSYVVLYCFYLLMITFILLEILCAFLNRFVYEII